MRSIRASAAARRLLATSIIARLPLAMLSIGLLVHVERLTGSFAAAGIVSGTYGIGVSVGSPLLGRLVDRRGQTGVLLGSATIAAVLLCTIAILPAGTSVAAPVALAIGIGLATPPVGACLRAQLPSLLADPADAPAAYAFETSVVELTWICGPPLVLGLGVLWSTGAALAVGGLVLLVASAAFAVQPGSRGRRPESAANRRRRGALRTPGVRTLTLVLLAVGVLLGADEVAVNAAARALGAAPAAAPLFALWGAGSFAGGLLSTRLGGGARTAAGLALLLGALGVGHLGLIPASGSLIALGAVLFVAGAAIAPAEASVYTMVDDAAPAGAVTEAFAWLAGAIEIGAALGAAGAGTLIDHAGPNAAFALGGTAGALAVLATLLRRRTLAGRRGQTMTREVQRDTAGDGDGGGDHASEWASGRSRHLDHGHGRDAGSRPVAPRATGGDPPTSYGARRRRRGDRIGVAGSRARAA
jgi:predicted MFS family arabinose efflux permease